MTITIFVMEMGLDSRIPTYSGGLGMLAGDMAFSFADLGIPATFVTLLSRNGYTSQKLDRASGQVDSPQPWDVRRLLSQTNALAEVEVRGRAQKVGALEYRIRRKAEASVLFLDVDYPENDPEVREAAERLYGGEAPQRLLQDIILGVGGYRILKALGRDVQVYHLNESHAAFVIVELLRETGSAAATRRRCVFTTHTPIPVGADVFPLAAVQEAFEKYPWMNWGEEAMDGCVNLRSLAAKYSGVTNAVSMKHRFVSESVVGTDGIVHVTNGVYHRRWVHPELKKVFDRHIPGWEDSPSLLARAVEIPSEDLASTHATVKEALVSSVNERTGAEFRQDALTVSVAKRVTAYKRNGMILNNPMLLERIASEKGDVQVILAGKTHPNDAPAKMMLTDIVHKADLLNRGTRKVRVALLENYDIEMAKLLVAGSDVWLNNPRRPLEACGTSGMKAAMNGVLNLSVHDGWWLEIGLEGVNGWGIGKRADWDDLGHPPEGEDESHLYSKLADSVLPLYYHGRKEWLEMAKFSIASVGPFFNSYRMIKDYVTKVYSSVQPSLRPDRLISGPSTGKA